MLKVGSNAYEVNLDRDPQAHPGSTGAGSAIATRVGQDDDPLAQQMNQLKNAAGGSVRRSGQWKPSQQQSPPGGSGLRRDPNGKLSPPPGGAPPVRDYRNSAEIVVGYPPQAATSRPASPNPPTNVFMKPPSQHSAAGSTVSVQNVLADYQQSLPGEGKSISRSNSRSNSISVPPTEASSIRGRPLSSESGRAGIGAQGRSTSPQPFASVSRSASPAMQPIANNRNSFGRPPTGNGPPPGHGHAHSGSTTRGGSISIPAQPAHQQRPTSPSIGIQLDPTGRVVADDMANNYRQPQHAPPQIPPQAPYGAPQPQQVPGAQPQRRPSYSGPAANVSYAPPPQQYPPGGGPMYNPPPPQAPSQYGAPAPVQQPGYGAPPQQQYGSQIYQPPPQGYAQPPGNALVQQRGVNGGYYPPTQQPVQQYRPPSPRAPSPQPPANQPPPTGQYTDDGRGVLFYGA